MRRAALGKALVSALLLVCLGLTVDRLFARARGPQMEQAWLNARFADRPSLMHAFEHYPKLWPPLYPLLLRLWRHTLHLPSERLNEVLFLASLPLLWFAARRIAPDQSPLPLAAFWAVAHFNQKDFYQLTSDALMVPLTLALYLGLVLYRERPDALRLVVVVVVTGLLAGARYFSVFSLVPVAAAVVVATPGLNARRRLARLTALALGLLPLLAWIGHAWATTGYITGADRRETRHFPEAFRYLAAMTTPLGNVYSWSKTFFLDFFSTHRTGALAFVVTEYDPYPLEWLLLALAVLCAGLALLGTRRLRQPRGAAAAEPVRWSPAPVALAALMFFNYTLMLLVIWSFGNNDPLHSRYLWPSYPLLLLLAHAAYARARAAWPESVWPRLPFQLLWALLLVVHVQLSVEAVPVPVPFDLEPGSDTLDGWWRAR
jgi:hypothetical protein